MAGRILLVLLLACTQLASARLDKDDAIYMEVKGGTVVIQTLPDIAPNHVKRIFELVRSGFYDGLLFHRVIAGFVAQGGDPIGEGYGGTRITIDAEFQNQRGHNTGTVNMARATDVNSADTQFSIMLVPNHFLDNRYTVWGQVLGGMQHVHNIKKGNGSDGRPSDPIDEIITMRIPGDLEQDCEDKYDECSYWATPGELGLENSPMGECVHNAEWMTANCPVSCGMCKVLDVPVRPCLDLYRDCELWATPGEVSDEGECVANPSWMRKNCRLSCHPSCQSNATTAAPVSTSSSVTETSVTPATTAATTTVVTTTAATTTVVSTATTSAGSSCVDLWPLDCPIWAQPNQFSIIGECVRRPNWTKKNCAKSCNRCEPDAGPPAPLPECMDFFNCTEQLLHYPCDDAFMVKNCRVTCSLCNPDGSTSASPSASTTTSVTTKSPSTSSSTSATTMVSTTSSSHSTMFDPICGGALGNLCPPETPKCVNFQCVAEDSTVPPSSTAPPSSTKTPTETATVTAPVTTTATKTATTTSSSHIITSDPICGGALGNLCPPETPKCVNFQCVAEDSTVPPSSTSPDVTSTASAATTTPSEAPTTASSDCSEDAGCDKCGENGCIRCGNSLYLLDGQCHSGCPETHNGWGVGRTGRVCVATGSACRLADGCVCPEGMGKCEACVLGANATAPTLVGAETHVVCSECRADRFLINGKCVRDATCKNRRILDELTEKLSCSCKVEGDAKQDDCYTCSQEYSQGTLAHECKQCKSSMYLAPGVGKDGAPGCVGPEECPDGTVPAGVGTFGRACMAPFQCHKGKHKETKKQCKCEDNGNCMSCMWDEKGSTCLKCTNGLYLHEGACVPECPAGLTSFGAKKNGRACRKPFVCKRSKDPVTGEACKCPSPKACHTCLWTADNKQGEAKCVKCRGGTFLHEDACLAECPDGFKQDEGKGSNGRECEAV